MAGEYKMFAVFGSTKTRLYTDFRILPDRYIQIGHGEPIPIEDYGDWMLFKETVTEEQAEERFLAALAGEEQETQTSES